MNSIVADLIESHRHEIREVCRRHAVRRLRLFGSALGDDWDPDGSDLDFLVEYLPERRLLAPLDALVGVKLGLEDALGIPVDAVDWDAVSNPFLRDVAQARALEIYAA